MRLVFYKEETAHARALAGSDATDWIPPRGRGPGHQAPQTLWGQILERPVRAGYEFFEEYAKEVKEFITDIKMEFKTNEANKGGVNGTRWTP